MSEGGYEYWLRSKFPWPGPWWQKFWTAIGKAIDEQNERLRLAGGAAKPNEALDLGTGTLAYQRALDLLGQDRQILRGGSTCSAYDQTDANYAADLQSAWEQWAQDDTPLTGIGAGGGSVKGMLLQLQRNGFPTGQTGATVVNHNGRWFQLIDDELVFGDCMHCVNRQQLDRTIPDPPLHGFTLDPRDQFYSHFMILFLADLPLYNNVGQQTARARLNSIVKSWKSASAIYHGAMVILDGPVWGWPPESKWGDSGLKWGHATTNRFIYPDGYVSPLVPAY
jgi:hypothetical protein